MSKWKDKINYSKNQEITESQIKLGGMKISVHRHINYAADVWFVSCYFFDKKELTSKDLDQAKTQAKAMFQVKIEEVIGDILS